MSHVLKRKGPTPPYVWYHSGSGQPATLLINTRTKEVVEPTEKIREKMMNWNDSHHYSYSVDLPEI